MPTVSIETNTALQTDLLARARKHLDEQHPKFKSLSPELQAPLIEQCAFILSLNSDYDFVGNTTADQELSDYDAKLSANMARAIAQQESDDQVMQHGSAEYTAIKAKLTKIDAAKRRELFLQSTLAAPRQLVAIIKSKITARPVNSTRIDPVEYMIGFMLAAYAYCIGLVSPRFVVNLLRNTAVLGFGINAAMARRSASTAIILDIDEHQATLARLPEPYDAAFLYQQEEYWNKIKRLNSTTDVTRVKSEYFKKKYDAVKQSLLEFYNKKEKEVKKAARKFATDSTSSWKDLIYAAVQVMSGMVLTVSVILLTVFALSGLTGPFLFFVFVPALSTSIIAALAVVAAKLNFEGNKTANDLIDWFVWLAYSPVVLVSSALEFLFQPITLTAAMLQKDSDGNLPSKRNRLTGAMTIGLAVGLAVVLGVALPYMAPVIGITAGVAVAVGVISGAYTGLTLGVLAKSAFERVYNRPKVRLCNVKNNLLPTLKIIDLDNDPVVQAFTQLIPEIAPQVLRLLTQRADDIRIEIDALETELPKLWLEARAYADAGRSASTGAVAANISATITPEAKLHQRITAIAEKITNLQVSQDHLLEAFSNFNANPNEDNSLVLAGAVEDILLTEYEIAKREFETAALERSVKAKDPQYRESIKPAIIFNNASSRTAKEPNFDFPKVVSHAQARKKLTELRVLEEKSRAVLKARILRNN